MSESSIEAAFSRMAGVVYANSPEDADKAYTEWAKVYEKDISETLDSVSNDELAKDSLQHIKNENSATLLDVAAGTGIIGMKLRELGYKGVMDALELNAAMLKKAEEKGIYRHHFQHRVTPTDPLPVPLNSYDAVTVSGAFGPNHLEPGCLRPIVNCLKPGGLVIFNTRSTEQNKEYRANLAKYVEEMTKSGKIQLVDEKEVTQYRQKSMTTGSPTTVTM